MAIYHISIQTRCSISIKVNPFCCVFSIDQSIPAISQVRRFEKHITPTIHDNKLKGCNVLGSKKIGIVHAVTIRSKHIWGYNSRWVVRKNDNNLRSRCYTTVTLSDYQHSIFSRERIGLRNKLISKHRNISISKFHVNSVREGSEVFSKFTTRGGLPVKGSASKDTCG